MWSIFIVCVKWMGLTLNKYVNTILVAWYQSIQKKKKNPKQKTFVLWKVSDLLFRGPLETPDWSRSNMTSYAQILELLQECV